MTVTHFMKNKCEVLEKFKESISMAENFTGKKLKPLISDNCGENISKEFDNFCKQHGIIQEPTIPRTPPTKWCSRTHKQDIVRKCKINVVSRENATTFLGRGHQYCGIYKKPLSYNYTKRVYTI